MKKLSILICTITGREFSLSVLLKELEYQKKLYDLEEQVEILTCKDNKEMTVGAKRNLLKSRAVGEYICFIDDDDMVSRNYLKSIFAGMNMNNDIINFTFSKYIDGVFDKYFCPNVFMGNMLIGQKQFVSNMLHLCPHKREIAKGISFTAKNIGEDNDYSMLLKPLLKTEKIIDEPLYLYFSVKPK